MAWVASSKLGKRHREPHCLKPLSKRLHSEAERNFNSVFAETQWAIREHVRERTRAKIRSGLGKQEWNWGLPDWKRVSANSPCTSFQALSVGGAFRWDQKIVWCFKNCPKSHSGPAVQSGVRSCNWACNEEEKKGRRYIRRRFMQLSGWLAGEKHVNQAPQQIWYLETHSTGKLSWALVSKDSGVTKKLPGYPASVNMADDRFSYGGFTRFLLHLPSEDGRQKTQKSSLFTKVLTHFCNRIWIARQSREIFKRSAPMSNHVILSKNESLKRRYYSTFWLNYERFASKSINSAVIAGGHYWLPWYKNIELDFAICLKFLVMRG